MERLKYTLSIATRNRLEALQLSIPLMLLQDPQPSHVIVVDSSEDHSSVKTLIESFRLSTSVPITLIQSDRGSSRQRNRSLQEIQTPVVFFPDDDSIFYPDTANQILKVYENDAEGRIAAVCAAESMEPPPTFKGSQARAYRMKKSDVFRQKGSRLRGKFERAFAPDPAVLAGRSFYLPENLIPSWWEKANVVPVEWMTGFRMTFRTEVIRNVKFDETLTEYSLFEDMDASFGAWKFGAVVAALNARIYHYKSPEKRNNGRKMGSIQLLNKAYVLAKHTTMEHVSRHRFTPFALYKILQYLLGSGSAYGRDRLSGAVGTLKHSKVLLTCPQERIREVYKDLAAQIF